MVITRDLIDITDDNKQSSKAPQISSSVTNPNDDRQHDFAVSTTPTPPISAKAASQKETVPKSSNNGSYHRRNKVNVNQNKGNDIQALQNLLGLIQRNIQTAQSQQAQQLLTDSIVCTYPCANYFIF